MTISGRLGADYPAFYAAGRMVSKGELKEIYNPELQAAEQKYLMGNEIGYLPFGYPPYVALFYWEKGSNINELLIEVLRTFPSLF